MTEVTNSFLSQPTGGNSGDQKQTNNTKNPERLGTNTRQKLSEDDDDDGNDAAMCHRSNRLSGYKTLQQNERIRTSGTKKLREGEGKGDHCPSLTACV